MYRKLVTGSTVAALALSGAGIAMAAGGGGSAQSGGSTPQGSASTEGVYSCNGGAQKQTLTRTNRDYFTFGEGGEFSPPGMTLWVSGPKHGYDTLNVTFSAESQLRNRSANDSFDWMQLKVLVDGNPIQPYGTAGDLQAFTGSREYSSNAAQFCTKIGRGKHKVTVVTSLVDNGTDDSLTGWLDDMTLNAVRSE